MDETMVAEYPLVDISQRIAAVTPVRYPMAGMTSHRVTVGVYNLASGRTVYLQTDSTSVTDPGSHIEYLTNVTWSPDEKSIYVACLNRDQNFMQMNRYDASTGRYQKTLFVEKNNTYVEPQAGPAFLPGDGDRFLWLSRRDGFNHFYLYNSDGGLIRQVTGGRWEVSRFILSDPRGRFVYFQGNMDNPIGSQVCVADLKKETVSRLTGPSGTHNGRISDDGMFILDTYSTPSVSRKVEVLDAGGSPLRVLLESPNPLAEYKLGSTSVVTLKSDDGSDLYARLIKPADFSPDKKYPAIIYVYGGPHSQLVTDSWLNGGGLFLNYLADLGYLVFTLDNRGTSNRGQDFEQAIFRNLGEREVADQMTGVRYLKSLSFADSTRIGINGWSYGGFMTISMFLKNPGVFKVAVCGGPVTDWKYYEVMYGERYMDTPETNPEGYRNACLLNYVRNLQGKLLIIHDDQDETVVPQNSLTFLKKCVDEGKQVDFFIYPGHEHNVRGKDRVHLNQKMVQYFQENL
jgi:dipeptidyl-peptidase-4